RGHAAVSRAAHAAWGSLVRRPGPPGAFAAGLFAPTPRGGDGRRVAGIPGCGTFPAAGGPGPAPRLCGYWRAPGAAPWRGHGIRVAARLRAGRRPAPRRLARERPPRPRGDPPLST